MVEDLHATKRHFSSLTSVVRNWHYESSTPKGASSIGSAQGPFQSTVQHQTTQEINAARIARQTESVYLFPGYAVRHYVDGDRSKYDLDVYVSGYATAQRSPKNITRTQRTFLRLAKGYAALNKLAEARSGPTSPRIPLNEGPKDDDLVENLDECFNKARENSDTDVNVLPYNEDIPRQTSNEVSCPDISDLLLRWEDNLQSRMGLFWPNMLSSRVVRLELFISHDHKESGHSVSSYDINTEADGTFQRHFHIKWDDIHHHSHHRFLAHLFGDHTREHHLILHAKLLESPTATTTNVSPDTKTVAEQVITVTNTPIRVISDIDDTIKMSHILRGARTIFRNVFVHDLEETTIPGMGEWYTNMWQRGIRFHYVSNGPIQLLPLVLQFFDKANLPSGSIRLKSYRARTLFNNLLTPPAERKREGLAEILCSFQDSKFILIGDSGEQDLELYSQLAKIHPAKILAILIRDVESELQPTRDPCGLEWKSHITSKNTNGNDDNGYISSLSRSNSLLGMAKFAVGRSNSRSWSFSNSGSSPILPPLPADEDIVTPTSPIGSEDSYKRPSSKDPSWLPPSPTHTSQLSTSPVSDSVLSRNRDRRSTSDNTTSLSFSNASSKSTGSISSDVEMTTSLSTIGGESRTKPANENGRTTTIMFADKDIISEPPEQASVLRSDSTSNSLKSSPRRTTNLKTIQHKLRTVSDVVSLRRNTTHPSSSAGSSGNASLTSPSALSLPGMARHRGMSEGERKRAELQNRVWRARSEVPEHIVLRIFRHPSDCVEVEGILGENGL